MEGKKISIFYEDGTGRVSRKDGNCTKKDEQYIELDNNVLIPIIRIVRIEIKEENNV